MIRLVLFSLIVLLALCPVANGDLIVNEILSNEPGSTRGLEWFELYNSSSTAANLLFREIRIHTYSFDDTLTLMGSVDSCEYLVVCRNLVLYEQHWGDNSGAWGDMPEENYEVCEVHFELVNDSGWIEIILAGQPESRLTWVEPGDDGHSWELVSVESNVVEQSTAPRGATPGQVNSRTLLPHDLALENVQPEAVDGFTEIAFTIINMGLTPDSNTNLNLHYFDALATDSIGDLIASEPIGVVDTGFTIILVGLYQFSGMYQQLVAKLDDDDRAYNNRIDFTAPGSDYPPVILSEFLANPQNEPSSEWVELKNVSQEPVDLVGWQLGDSIGLVEITSVSLVLQPGTYLVLADDTLAFLSDYFDFTGDLYQPGSWRELNNGSDWVRLFDVIGIEADRFVYDRVFDGNITWARGESEEHRDDWDHSEDVGGTPGEANRIRFSAPRGNDLEISVSPQIFSPDGDSWEDYTEIKLLRPEAREYTLRIYDRHGRLVKTFAHRTPDLDDSYLWDGRNDGGERLPIGIYILYVEAAGVESVKRTIVIAR